MNGSATCTFDASIFKRSGEHCMTMGSVTVIAKHLPASSGVHFEVMGEKYLYRVAASDDQAVVKVYNFLDEHRGTTTPRTQEELLQVIETIAVDFENGFDE